MLGRNKPGPKRRKWEVRIVDDGEHLSEWVPAEKLCSGEFRIAKEDHPVFGGEIYHKKHLEIREAVQ